MVAKGVALSPKNVARLVWILCALVVTGAVAAAIFAFQTRPAEDSLINRLESLPIFFMLVIFAVTGALVIAHQPGNTVGWLLMIESTVVFGWPFDTYFNSLVLAPTPLTPLTYLGMWIYGWLWLWLIFPIIFIPLFFPTGRLLSPRWRWVVILGLGLCFFFIIFVTFVDVFTDQAASWSVTNPIGFIPLDSFPLVPWSVALLSFVFLCTASIFVRYRRAQQVEREQIKWFLYAACLFFVVYTLSFLFSELEGFLGELLGFLLFVVPMLLPIAILIAILRYHLYDINVIIRKTLLYALLTTVLALVYFGTVVLLQGILETASGQQSPFAIVVSTLLIAALFAPLRRRIQEVIDRRFFRQKYDAQQVLAGFALTARDETELDQLTAELLQVVQETMQPERVALWLKESRQ